MPNPLYLGDGNGNTPLGIRFSPVGVKDSQADGNQDGVGNDVAHICRMTDRGESED